METLTSSIAFGISEIVSNALLIYRFAIYKWISFFFNQQMYQCILFSSHKSTWKTIVVCIFLYIVLFSWHDVAQGFFLSLHLQCHKNNLYTSPHFIEMDCLCLISLLPFWHFWGITECLILPALGHATNSSVLCLECLSGFSVWAFSEERVE